MPSSGTLQRLTNLELDFALSCPGRVDADCPAWDHVLQLFVCCSQPCAPCKVYRHLTLRPQKQLAVLRLTCTILMPCH